MNLPTETQLEFDFMKPSQLNFDWDHNVYFSGPNSLSLMTITQHRNIVFTNENGQVGKLDWNDDKMKFIGNADESAQLFFEYIITRYIQTTLPLDGWKS